MKAIRFFASVAIVVSGLAGQAQAQLLGVTKDPSISNTAAQTPSAYLVYDHDGGKDPTTGQSDTTIGLLRFVAGSSVLTEPTSAGGNSTSAQSHFLTGGVPDVLLSIQVRNGTGGYAAGSFVSGVVSIGFGTATGFNRWKWDGTITALGSQSRTSPGTIIDARWTVSADQYQNLPSTLSQYVNSYLAGGTGGIMISSTADWGSAANFGNDWVFGGNQTNPSTVTGLNTYRTGMTSPIQQTASTISADIFASPVPEPSEALLLLAGLALLVPLARVRQAA